MAVVTKAVAEEAAPVAKKSVGPVFKTSDLVKILVNNRVDLTNSQQLRVVRVIASEIKKSYPRFSETTFFNSLLEKSKKVQSKKELAALQERKSRREVSERSTGTANLRDSIKNILNSDEDSISLRIARDFSSGELDAGPVQALYVPVVQTDCSAQLFTPQRINPCVIHSLASGLRIARWSITRHPSYKSLYQKHMEPLIKDLCTSSGIYYSTDLYEAERTVVSPLRQPNVRDFIPMLVKVYREGLVNILKELEDALIVPPNQDEAITVYNEDEEVAAMVNYFEKEGAN